LLYTGQPAESPRQPNSRRTPRHEAANAEIVGSDAATFQGPACFEDLALGKIAMKTVPNAYFRRVLPLLRQSPMLTALMVYFVGLCMAASIAAAAVRRENSRGPSPEALGQPYLLVQAAPPARQILELLPNRALT
jgi:hypothetical protein